MTIDMGKELKRKLVQETNFSGFMDYFFTNFAAKEGFLKRGRVLAPPQAQALWQMIGEAHEASGTKSGVRVSGNLVEIPEMGLIHGAFLLDGQVAAVVYFSDIAMGMCSVTTDLLAGKTMYMRFGGQLPTNSPPS